MQKVTSQQLVGLWQEQRFEELERACLGGLSAGQDQATIRYFLGLARLELKSPRDALEPLQVITKQRPEIAEYRVALARAYLDLGERASGFTYLAEALALEPALFDAIFRLSVALQYMPLSDATLSWQLRALTIGDQSNPAIALALHLPCINSYFFRHQNLAAMAHNAVCLVLEPNNAEAWRLHAVLAGFEAKYEIADIGFNRAMSCECDDPQIHYQRGILDLTLGRFETGWKGYESRKKVHGTGDSAAIYGSPEWKSDQDLRGKHLLLTFEQGIGDTIQFSRFATNLANAGAKIYMLVQPAVAPLVSSIPGVHWSRVLTPGQAIPRHDFHCALMSVPERLDLRLEDIPAKVPYLSAPDDRINYWREQLPKHLPGRKLRVGLVWSGNPSHFKNSIRSIPPQFLFPLFDLAGISWISLTNEVSQADRDILGPNADLFLLADDPCNSYVDAAAVVSLCDAIISVDTSFAHLAGAMARPLFLALGKSPDFRWLTTGDSSPWYPTARLFRQRDAGDWTPIIESIAREITVLRDQFIRAQSNRP